MTAAGAPAADVSSAPPRTRRTPTMTDEPAPLTELTDDQLNQLAAGINAQLQATPQGTPGRDDIIRQWGEVVGESNRRDAQRGADAKGTGQ